MGGGVRVATWIEERSPIEQFFLGFGAGIGVGLAVWYGPAIAVRSAGFVGKFLATQIGQFIVMDIAIGRVPLLSTTAIDPKTGQLVSTATKFPTKGAIVGTVLTTLFYLAGGTGALINEVKLRVGLDIADQPNELGHDDILIDGENPSVWDVGTRSGRLQYVTHNASLVDP